MGRGPVCSLTLLLSSSFLGPYFSGERGQDRLPSRRSTLPLLRLQVKHGTPTYIGILDKQANVFRISVSQIFHGTYLN